MLLLTLSALAASAQPAVREQAPRAAPSVRATGRATVTLLEARVVPMSADSRIEANARPSTIHLADGDHQAIILEFE